MFTGYLEQLNQFFTRKDIDNILKKIEGKDKIVVTEE